MNNQTVLKRNDKIMTPLVPFEHERIVGHNVNYLGIFINQLLMFCRYFMILSTSFKISSSALLIIFTFNLLKYVFRDMNVENTLLSRLRNISFYITLTANLCLLLDCMNVSYYMKTLSDYVSSMTFSRFAQIFGINVHLLRAMIVTISVFLIIVTMNNNKGIHRKHFLEHIQQLCKSRRRRKYFYDST